METDAAAKEELKKKMEREEARIRDAGTFENEKEAARRQKALKIIRKNLKNLKRQSRFPRFAQTKAGFLYGRWTKGRMRP